MNFIRHIDGMISNLSHGTYCFKEGELNKGATVKESLTVQSMGNPTSKRAPRAGLYDQYKAFGTKATGGSQLHNSYCSLFFSILVVLTTFMNHMF